jgi:hypothetical protein
MHYKDIKQSDDNKVNLLSKIVDSNDKRHNLFLELQGDLCFMAVLKNIFIITTNVHHNQNFYTKENGNPLPLLDHMQVDG